VADQKPPRRAGDERATLLGLLQYQRESLVRKVDGVSEEAARWSPVPSGTSLLWLATHMAGAERTWVLERFAGLEDEGAGAPATVAEALALYRRTWERVDDALSGAPSLDERCRCPGEGAPVDLRWVLAHLLEETARHAGHADILRELIDGATGR